MALDNNRKGITLGIGIGKSDLTFDLEQTNLPVPYNDINLARRRSNLNNMATNFKIGYGINNHFLLYWNSRVSWFGEGPLYSSLNDESNNKITSFITGVAGLGFSWYFQDTVPSPFICGTVGYSNVGNRDAGKNRTGFGLGFGAGYEFSRHWNAELAFNLGAPGENKADDLIITNIFCCMITLNWVIY